MLQLCLVLSSTVQSRPDRCCHCHSLARQMQPLCGSWLLPSCACQCLKMMYLCTYGKVTACGPVTFCYCVHYLLSFCHFWRRGFRFFWSSKNMWTLSFSSCFSNQQMFVKHPLQMPEKGPCLLGAHCLFIEKNIQSHNHDPNSYVPEGLWEQRGRRGFLGMCVRERVLSHGLWD